MRCRNVCAVDERLEQYKALKALTEEERLLTECRKGRRGPYRHRRTILHRDAATDNMRSPSVEQFVGANECQQLEFSLTTELGLSSMAQNVSLSALMLLFWQQEL